jgi:homoserine kinase type II
MTSFKAADPCGPNADALSVLSQFALPDASFSLHSLGNAGGFSGAMLWRVASPTQSLCLKAWSQDCGGVQHLHKMHALMTQARQSGVAVVPIVVPSKAGPSAVFGLGRPWDLTQWMPGLTLEGRQATATQIRAACEVLARIHRAWNANRKSREQVPALEARRRRLTEWQQLLATGWRPVFDRYDLVRPWAEKAFALGTRYLEHVGRRLEECRDLTVELQYCLGDVWSQNLLFEGEVVSGLVDFGAVRIDSVAGDLARLLGSISGDNQAHWALGLEAYNNVRRLSATERQLADVLDETGTVLSLTRWLTALYRDGQHVPDRDTRQRIASRLQALVQRIEGWEKGVRATAAGVIRARE